MVLPSFWPMVCPGVQDHGQLLLLPILGPAHSSGRATEGVLGGCVLLWMDVGALTSVGSQISSLFVFSFLLVCVLPNYHAFKFIASISIHPAITQISLKLIKNSVPENWALQCPFLIWPSSLYFHHHLWIIYLFVQPCKS